MRTYLIALVIALAGSGSTWAQSPWLHSVEVAEMCDNPAAISWLEGYAIGVFEASSDKTNICFDPMPARDVASAVCRYIEKYPTELRVAQTGDAIVMDAFRHEFSCSVYWGG